MSATAQRDPSASPSEADLQRESLRQQALLACLWQRQPDADLRPWLRGSAAQQARGLLAYRANGAAVAARALTAAYPTLAQVLGEPALTAMARQLWHAHPPQRGDLAHWGGALADWLAQDDEALQRWPWLPDLARLDWRVHQAQTWPDADASPPDPDTGLPPGLQGLAEADAPQRQLHLVQSLDLLDSPWPVVTLWLSHQQTSTDPGAEACPVAKAGTAADITTKVADATPAETDVGHDRPARAECALVWRDGWRVRVRGLGTGDAAFMHALQAHQPLGLALDAALAADPAWAFEAWLGQALQNGWIAAPAPAA